VAKPKDKQPWFKFYPQDWRGDAELRSCSIGARGLWAEMLCIMHQADPYGHLLINGKPVLPRQLAKLAGISDAECMKFILELESAGVYSRADDKTVYSRRMVRDKAKAEQAKLWGKGGGNPDLKGQDKGRVNPQDNPRDIPQSTRKPDFDVAEAGREPLVSSAARDLADELLVIAGHDLRFVPPGWCGAAMRVHTWLANGWQPEVIVAAVKSASAKKRGAPANSVQFFENAIADEVARQSAPLPVVEVQQPEKRTVTHGRSQGGNILQAADRLVDTIRGFDAGPDEADSLRGGTGAPATRLLS
jgi:hypothetical protein